MISVRGGEAAGTDGRDEYHHRSMCHVRRDPHRVESAYREGRDRWPESGCSTGGNPLTTALRGRDA